MLSLLLMSQFPGLLKLTLNTERGLCVCGYLSNSLAEPGAEQILKAMDSRAHI